jgi:hypothetical protein
VVSTWRSELNLRERAFLSWLAPRGIVAAAVASLFAQSLAARGMAGGEQLQALVFMVIAVTVLVQGLTGGLVARALGLRRETNAGYAIFGANELGHTLGSLLRSAGETVVFLDSNPGACHVVEQDGFKVVFGNVLEERTLIRARIDDRAAAIGVTTNAEANLLFVRHALEDFKVPAAYVALGRDASGVSDAMVKKAGGRVLFGVGRDLELWALRLRRGLAPIESWRFAGGEASPSSPGLRTPENLLLPLLMSRKGRIRPVHDASDLRPRDVVRFAVFAERAEESRRWLEEAGWEAAETPAPEGAEEPPGAEAVRPGGS